MRLAGNRNDGLLLLSQHCSANGRLLICASLVSASVDHEKMRLLLLVACYHKRRRDIHPASQSGFQGLAYIHLWPILAKLKLIANKVGLLGRCTTAAAQKDLPFDLPIAMGNLGGRCPCKPKLQVCSFEAEPGHLVTQWYFTKTCQTNSTNSAGICILVNAQLVHTGT